MISLRNVEKGFQHGPTRTFVLRREGATWRIVHLHGSNVRRE